jgi:hypothetical protein
MGLVNRAARRIAFVTIAGLINGLADRVAAFLVARLVLGTAHGVAAIAIMRLVDRPVDGVAFVTIAGLIDRTAGFVAAIPVAGLILGPANRVAFVTIAGVVNGLAASHGDRFAAGVVHCFAARISLLLPDDLFDRLVAGVAAISSLAIISRGCRAGNRAHRITCSPAIARLGCSSRGCYQEHGSKQAIPKDGVHGDGSSALATYGHCLIFVRKDSSLPSNSRFDPHGIRTLASRPI